MNDIALEKRWQRKAEILAPICNTQSQKCVFFQTKATTLYEDRHNINCLKARLRSVLKIKETALVLQLYELNKIINFGVNQLHIFSEIVFFA